MRLPEAHAAARPPRFCSCITLRGRFAVERRSAVMRVSTGRRSPVNGNPGRGPPGRRRCSWSAPAARRIRTPRARPSRAMRGRRCLRSAPVAGPEHDQRKPGFGRPHHDDPDDYSSRTGPTRTDHRLAVSGALPKSTVRHRVRIGFPSQSSGSCTEWSTDRLGPHRVGIPPHFKPSVRWGPGRRRARAVALNGPSRDIAPPSTILDNPQSFSSRACGRAEGRASGVERSH